MTGQPDQTLSRGPPLSRVDLVMEANHRIANNLNALVLMLRRHLRETQTGPETLSRDNVAGTLTRTVANVVAISRLHQRLTMQPSERQVDLHAVLANILTEFEQSGLCGDRLHVRPTLSAGCMLDATRASTLALAFSEIITNAIKYAHPTGLPVELEITSARMADGSMVLQISDDGVGFPEGFVEERDAGIGLRLVRSLVESVGGRLEIKSDPLGLVFTIHMAPGPPQPGPTLAKF